MGTKAVPKRLGGGFAHAEDSDIMCIKPSQSAVSIVEKSDLNCKGRPGPSRFGLWPYKSFKLLAAPLRRRAVIRWGHLFGVSSPASEALYGDPLGAGAQLCKFPALRFATLHCGGDDSDWFAIRPSSCRGHQPCAVLRVESIPY
jgi:hypothetical protein